MIETAKILHLEHPEAAMFDPDDKDSLDLRKIIDAETEAEPLREHLRPLLPKEDAE
jgi:hypothetical protein